MIPSQSDSSFDFVNFDYLDSVWTRNQIDRQIDLHYISNYFGIFTLMYSHSFVISKVNQASFADAIVIASAMPVVLSWDKYGHMVTHFRCEMIQGRSCTWLPDLVQVGLGS